MMEFKRLIVAVNLAALCCSIQPLPSLAADNASPSSEVTSSDDFSARYGQLTKKVLLNSIELERYSLSYRLENCRRPLMSRLIFFGAQEAGAANLLAFEATATQQFGRGRNKPLSLNKAPLQRSLRAAEVGSIIAASGSGYQLAANAVNYVRSRKRGFDTGSANRFVTKKLKDIDALLSERETLVAANCEHPAYQRAVLEGKILHALRRAFVDEYAQFSANSRSESAARNLFFLMNAAYNTVGAIGAAVGYTAVDEPKLNGTSNILFTITGAMAAATPLVSSAMLWTERKLILKAQMKRQESAGAKLAELNKEIQGLANTDQAAGTLMPTLPSTQRFALYSQSSELFAKQLENELTTIHRLDKVAVQSLLTGPVIGGLLMTQGILGTRGYYKYFPLQPKRQLDLSYKGAICGTVASSIAVVGNVAWLLATLSYENHLKKNKRLPEQLIRERLAHLDDLEKVVSAL